MGLVKYGIAVGFGYLLGRPEGRAQLRQVGQQVADLTKRPEVTRLKEQGKSIAADKVDAVKHKVGSKTASDTEGTATPADGTAELAVRPRRRIALPSQRLRFGRSRDTRFPASEGITPPASPGGTTVVGDSEAVVLGTPAAGNASPSTTDRS